MPLHDLPRTSLRSLCRLPHVMELKPGGECRPSYAVVVYGELDGACFVTRARVLARAVQFTKLLPCSVGCGI